MLERSGEHPIKTGLTSDKRVHTALYVLYDAVAVRARTLTVDGIMLLISPK